MDHFQKIPCLSKTFLLPICLLCACKGRERVFPFFLRLAALCMVLPRRFKILLVTRSKGTKILFQLYKPHHNQADQNRKLSFLFFRPSHAGRDLYPIGTTAEIFEFGDQPTSGSYAIKAKGRQRFKILDVRRTVDG